MEVLQAPKYQDISAGQWLGLTSRQVVGETLNLPDSFLDILPKTKRYIVPGDANYSTTNFTVNSYPNANMKSKRQKRTAVLEEAQPLAWTRPKAWEYD